MLKGQETCGDQIRSEKTRPDPDKTRPGQDQIQTWKDHTRTDKTRQDQTCPDL